MSALKNKKGFSLMELMTVVVIIAILSMIAIPSYNGFKARARQKEGMSLLTEYFIAAQGVKATWRIYPGNFVATGFAPKGPLGYRLRADDNPNDLDIMVDDQLCFRTQADCTCAGACTDFKTWEELPMGNLNTIGPGNVVPNPCGVPVNTDTQMRAQVSGWISRSATQPDIYQIDEFKTITLCQDGSK